MVTKIDVNLFECDKKGTCRLPHYFNQYRFIDINADTNRISNRLDNAKKPGYIQFVSEVMEQSKELLKEHFDLDEVIQTKEGIDLHGNAIGTAIKTVLSQGYGFSIEITNPSLIIFHTYLMSKGLV